MVYLFNMNISGLFSNREIAIFAWLFVFSVYVLRNRDVRKSLEGVFKTLFSGKILFPILLLAVYIGAAAYFLSHLGLWNITLLKDTLFWFFTAGTLTMFKYVTAKNGDIPVKELLFDNLKLIVILEFILNSFTLALWVELVIVPVITVVFMMNAYVEATKGDRKVAKLLGGIQAVFGLALIGHALYSAVVDYRSLGTFDTLRSFLLPILLSSAIIPVAYLMALYSNYESLFIGFKIGKSRKRSLVWYCKWRVMLYCGLSTKKIAHLRPFDLMHLESKQDVRSMLEERAKAMPNSSEQNE